ncbi:MAG: group 1 truncated hemoglobin [Pseudomonadota bacterium]
MATSMFNRYGGFANVSKIVMDFYDRVLDSDIVGDYFVDVDMPTLIDHQTKFMSSLMGGPASYSDEALERIHAKLTIGKPAYDELVLLLREALEEFEIEPADIDLVIDEIRSKERYIVNE